MRSPEITCDPQPGGLCGRFRLRSKVTSRELSPPGAVSLMEAVRGAVEEADPVFVQTPDQGHRVDAVLDEVVRMGSMTSCTPSASKIGNNSSIDFGNCASAVSGASGRPLNSELMTRPRFVRTGPALHRQDRGDAHPRIGGDLL